MARRHSPIQNCKRSLLCGAARVPLLIGSLAVAGLVLTPQQASAVCNNVVNAWTCDGPSNGLGPVPATAPWTFDLIAVPGLIPLLDAGATVVTGTNAGNALNLPTASFSGVFNVHANTLATSTAAVPPLLITNGFAADNIVDVNVFGAIGAQVVDGVNGDALRISGGNVVNINVGPTGSPFDPSQPPPLNTLANGMILGVDDGSRFFGTFGGTDPTDNIINQGSIIGRGAVAGDIGFGIQVDENIGIPITGGPTINITNFNLIEGRNEQGANTGYGLGLASEGAINVINQSSGVITGSTGGIWVHSGSTTPSLGGDVTITTFAGSQTLGGTADAVLIQTGGNVEINNSGLMQGGLTGVTVTSLGGIAFTNGPGGQIIGGETGAALISTTSVTATNHSRIQGTDFGLFAQISPGGTGDLGINNTGRITGTNGNAVFAFNNGPGNTLINNSGLLQNDNLAVSTVQITTTADATFHNQTGGLVQNSTEDTSNFAMSVESAGAFHLINDGTIIGNMRLIADQNIVIDNNSSHTWRWSGNNFFNSVTGSIFFNNNANGTASAGPNSLNQFNAAGDAIINNAGTFNIFSSPFGIGRNIFDFTGVAGQRLLNNTGTLNLDGFVDFLNLQALNNTGGTINTSNSTEVAFFGNSNVINNAGVININPSGQSNGLAPFPQSFTFLLSSDAVGNPSLLEFNNTGLLNMANGVSSYAGQGTPTDVVAGSPILQGIVTHSLAAYQNSVGDLTVIQGNFNGGSGSTLAVDAILAGPTTSASDWLVIAGNTTGHTNLVVNNTNPGLGAFNPQGILVVTAEGASTPAGSFTLANGPISAGFFDYDLFFVPHGSGDWVLRSFPGANAAILPQLVTAAQDAWFQTSSTWFDRTADLRVLLNGGTAPMAYNPDSKLADGTPSAPGITPAVWMRGSGAWLNRDRTERVTAYGNTYSYNLDRELDVIDLQMGLDLGHRGLFASDDILVFGVLGGFVNAGLDYNNRLTQNFDFSGGQVGAYATYLNGGLFVDTLFNAHLLELETRNQLFPNNLDATTVGVRTDSGYRFGSFGGGAFIEPLATIAVSWADIEGFAAGANRVSFDDEANVRGRLGLRVGTNYSVWGTTTVEPFVIGSLWGNLSGDNKATLTSSGTTFRFEDDLDDVWGEVSLGVNFFNPSALTAVFAKLDVAFGDDMEGIGGKAGMRVSW